MSPQLPNIDIPKCVQEPQNSDELPPTPKYSPIYGSFATVTVGYFASRETEISLSPGQSVEILDFTEQLTETGWARGKLVHNGEIGMFPLCCITPETNINKIESQPLVNDVVKEPVKFEEKRASYSSVYSEVSTLFGEAFAVESVYQIFVGYNKNEPDELSVSCGQDVEVLHVFSDGWIKGRIVGGNGETGMFPGLCLARPSNANKSGKQSSRPLSLKLFSSIK